MEKLIRRIKLYRYRQLALNWWNDLPIQDIMGNHGWANLTMIYYPDKGSCYGLTGDEILKIYLNEKILN
jgi:hypothetical protein